MIDSERKIVLITGCSSGIGLATAVHLAEQGQHVVATMRNLAKREKLDKALAEKSLAVTVLDLDITDMDSIKNTVERVIEKFGRIDVLVNNAGITIDGFFEDHTAEDVEWIFKTNVFGAFNTAREILPYMRKQGSGHIINIGSIAGRWALPQIGIYSSTKFAIEGFSEALKYEVQPFGIHVSIVEPCFVETEMVHENRNVASKSNTEGSAYNEMNEACETFYDEYGEKFSVMPADVAKKVHQVIMAKRPKLRYMLGRRENALKVLQGILPRRWFEKFLHRTFPKL